MFELPTTPVTTCGMGAFTPLERKGPVQILSSTINETFPVSLPGPMFAAHTEPSGPALPWNGQEHPHTHTPQVQGLPPLRR